MEQLNVLGDLHFGCSHDWDREAINKFIDWFESFDFGKFEENELIQLGDIVDKSSNLGDTIEYVTRFFKIACKKFKKIYVLGGNHCHKLYKEKSQYASAFLKHIGEYNQIETVFKESLILTPNNFHVIMLPYKRVNGKLLDEFYSDELSSKFYDTQADLLCGHVGIKEPKSFFGGISLNRFKTKRYAFGHIHSRNGLYKKYYTGSIMPFKINEEQSELPRCIKVFQRNNNVIKELEIQLPNIITYDKVNLNDEPQYKKNSDILVHIYSVVNCKNINQAKNLYPDYYIHGIEKKYEQLTTTTSIKDIFMTPIEALYQMIKEKKIIIKRKTMGLIEELLK